MIQDHTMFNRKKEHAYINMGKELFHALAIAFIDTFKNTGHTNLVKNEVAKKVLERLALCFPGYKLNPNSLPPVERLAYVLRQLTVDQLYAHPLRNKEVFADLDKDTPRSYLRDPSTRLPLSVVAELANALNITITLSFQEPRRELRKRQIFSDGSMFAARYNLVVQVQGEDYLSRVRNKADYMYARISSVLEPIVPEDAGTIEDIKALIAADNEEAQISFEQYRRSLLGLITDGELNKELLLALYSKFLPNVGADKTRVVQEAVVDADTYMVNSLVDTLAVGLSRKMIEEKTFFKLIERENESHLMHRASPTHKV